MVTAAHSLAAPIWARLFICDSSTSTSERKQSNARSIIGGLKDPLVIGEQATCSMGEFPKGQWFAALVACEPMKVRDDASFDKAHKVALLAQPNKKSQWRTNARMPAPVWNWMKKPGPCSPSPRRNDCCLPRPGCSWTKVFREPTHHRHSHL